MSLLYPSAVNLKACVGLNRDQLAVAGSRWGGGRARRSPVAGWRLRRKGEDRHAAGGMYGVMDGGPANNEICIKALVKF